MYASERVIWGGLVAIDSARFEASEATIVLTSFM